MARYEYDDIPTPSLVALETEIDEDSQLESHRDQNGEGHFEWARWDESGEPGTGVGLLSFQWSGDLCETCKTALDAIAEA